MEELKGYIVGVNIFILEDGVILVIGGGDGGGVN